jgi:hypothetical protein
MHIYTFTLHIIIHFLSRPYLQPYAARAHLPERPFPHRAGVSDFRILGNFQRKIPVQQSAARASAVDSAR